MALTAAGVGLLTGCALKPIEVREPDPAIVRMAQVAESIQKHANDLAAIEAAKYREVHGKDLKSIDPELIPTMMKVESLGHNYHGPLDRLVDKLAYLAGYDVLYV